MIRHYVSLVHQYQLIRNKIAYMERFKLIELHLFPLLIHHQICRICESWDHEDNKDNVNGLCSNDAQQGLINRIIRLFERGLSSFY